MITSDKAIEKAISFVSGLKPEYLGAKPERIMLETIQRFGKEWVVVVSYTLKKDGELTKEIPTGGLSDLLLARRYIKELEIDSESGEVIAMRNPEAPATTGVAIAA